MGLLPERNIFYTRQNLKLTVLQAPFLRASLLLTAAPKWRRFVLSEDADAPQLEDLIGLHRAELSINHVIRFARIRD